MALERCVGLNRGRQQTCAGKRADGSPCGAPAKGKTGHCRHHQQGADPAPERVDLRYCVAPLPAANLPPIAQHLTDWCFDLLEKVQVIATREAQEGRRLDLQRSKDELRVAIGVPPDVADVPEEYTLPLAAFVVFDRRGNMTVRVGWRQVEQHIHLTREGEQAEFWVNDRIRRRTFLGFLLSSDLTSLYVFGTPDLPSTASQLVNLEVLTLHRSRWSEIGAVKAGQDSALAPHPVCMEEVVRAPNGQANQELQRALVRPAHWQTNPDEASKFYAGPGMTFIYQPQDAPPSSLFEETVRNDALRALDLRFCQMNGDLVADVCDILLLHWLAAGRPNKAGITLLQILEYRKKQPERKTIQDHWQALRDTRSIRLRGGVLEDIALFEIDTLRPRQPNLFGLDSPPEADRAYYYSPGGTMSLALNKEQAYFAPYARRILELHQYNYNIAKRLARYLRGEWRMNPEGYVSEGPRRYRTWGDHLEDAGIEISDRFRRKGNEFFELLDDQLLELCRVKALGDWVPQLFRPEKCNGGWETSARLYHPEDRSRLRGLPYHGRLAAFLPLRVHLPPPEDVAEVLRTHLPGRLARRAQRESVIREAEIRKIAPGTASSRVI